MEDTGRTKKKTRDTASRADTMARAQNTRCRLLELPGELENRIYRYTLVQQSGIRVHPQGFEGPGILRACKEIRREALAIYMYENTLYVDQSGCDSTTLLKLTRTVKSLGLAEEKLVIDARIDISQPKWRDLLLWFRRVHAHEIYVRPKTPADLAELKSEDMRKYAIGGMVAVVDETEDLPWARVEKILVSMRPTLVVLDERWGQD